MSDWISVKDRLPEDKARVLIYAHERNNPETWIIDSGTYVPYGRFTFMFFLDHDREYRFKEISSHYTVTHWQPLPEPPREVSNDGE